MPIDILLTPLTRFRQSVTHLCRHWPDRRCALRLLIATVAVNSAAALVIWPLVQNPFDDLWVSAQIVGFTILAFLSPALRSQRRGWTRPALIATSLIAGALLGTALVVTLKGRGMQTVVSDPHYLQAFALTAMMGIVIGGIVSVIMLERTRAAVAENDRLQAEADGQRLARQAAEAELHVLKAQIEPHFLFNTLANLSFLIRKDADAASELLEHLIDYLQVAIPRMRQDSATVAQEIGMCSAYLNIQRIRMGARLQFSIDVPAALMGLRFPPMMLITLVENAIQHGVGPLREGGHVRLEGRKAEGLLVVEVTDDGCGVVKDISDKESLGVGLNNIDQRLRALYGERASWQLQRAANRGTVARIALPAEYPAPPAPQKESAE